MTTHRGIALYRSLLRAHAKYLPSEMRELGDVYVKTEFRQHQKVTNQEQLTSFYREWNLYLKQIEETARARETLSTGISNDDTKESKLYQFGSDLDDHVELTDEQKVQLANLKKEARNLEK